MERVIALEPDNAVPLHDMGWILLRAGRYEQAIRAFDDALALDPALEYSVVGRATAETALGNTVAGARGYASFVDMIETEARDAQIVDGSSVVEMNQGDRKSVV